MTTNWVQTDAELYQVVLDRYRRIYSYLYYGIEVQPRLVHASLEDNQMVSEIAITENEVGASGTLDEGWLGTVPDNTTAMIIGSLGDSSKKSVSTTISVQAVTPIRPNTLVEICCKVTTAHDSANPHAVAVFRNKINPAKIYAVRSQTKFYKSNLVGIQPKM